MGADTKIEWCDFTFNPWHGCVRVSPGCQNCYAEAFDRRTHGAMRHMLPSGEIREPHWGIDAPRRFFGDKHWAEPLKWDRAAEDAMNAAEHGQAGGASGCLPHRPRVFCASMADVFEDRPDLVPHRRRLFDLIGATENLDWQVLTKRPENVVPMMREIGLAIPSNVWLGTTCEDQQRADERIPHLLAVPAAVRFLSVEPMIERVDVSRGRALGADTNLGGIDWIICGGESGPGARPFHLWWARSLLAQAKNGGAAMFMKQLGARPVAGEVQGKSVPWDCDDPKGGDIAEFPEDLRVREFPR